MAAPAAGQWVLGTDASGKLYMFKQGAAGPGGTTGSYKGLTHYVPLTGDTGSPTFGTQLSNALGTLEHGAGVTAVQASGIIQSVDAGAIFKGGSYVAIPRSQQPGQTKPGQGQTKSGSEAVGAGINIGGLGDLLGLSGIEALVVRILEGMVGVALLLLALSALTGQSSGDPVSAVKTAARHVPL